MQCTRACVALCGASCRPAVPIGARVCACERAANVYVVSHWGCTGRESWIVHCAPVCCSTLYCCQCPSIEKYRNDDGKFEIRVSIAVCVCASRLQSLFRIRKGWICIFQAIIKTHHVIQREVEAVARPRSPRSGVKLDLLSPTSHRFGL